MPSDPLDKAGRVSCHQLIHSYLHGQTKDLVEEGMVEGGGGVWSVDKDAIISS